MSESAGQELLRRRGVRAGFIVAGLGLAGWAAATQASSFGAVHVAAALWLAAAAHARWMPGGAERWGDDAGAADGCTGRTPVGPECLDAILYDVMAVMHPLVRQQGIDLWLHAPADIARGDALAEQIQPAEQAAAAVVTVSDGPALRAVLRGLIGHAAAGSGTDRLDVSFAVDAAAAAGMPDTRRLRVWLRRGGDGIAADALRRSLAEGGALAECRRLVWAMGGSLLVHVDERAGTLMRLALPVALTPSSSGPAAASRPAGPTVRAVA